MFSFDKSRRARTPVWEVYTKAGVMFRECRQTHRLQYRNCATNQWVDVESHNALAWVIEDSQAISNEEPAWIRNRPEPEES